MKQGKRYKAIYSDGQTFRVYAFSYPQALRIAKDWAFNMKVNLRCLFLSRG
jgi:hypothetical protein